MSYAHPCEKEQINLKLKYNEYGQQRLPNMLKMYGILVMNVNLSGEKVDLVNAIRIQ